MTTINKNRGLSYVKKRDHNKEVDSFKELLFVYGSLKKGFDNHKLLDDKYAKRIGEASTVDKFAMYEDNFGNYPYLIKEPINQIRGELYEIEKKELLDKIDEFEGAPEYYQRKKIKVKTNKDTKQAFVYIRENEEIPKKQKSLKIWENNTDYKVYKLDSFLKSLY